MQLIQRVLKRFIYRTARCVLGITCRILLRLSKRDVHHVPQDGPFILACNHATWIDSLLLIVTCPRRVRFIITHTFHRKRFVHFFTHHHQCIPVDKKNPSGAIMVAIKALKDGQPVGIYPEGGFTRDGSIREIQRGLEVIARSAKCPTVPVVITGLFGSAFALRKEWRKDHLWKKPWPKARVTFGKPIGHEEISSELIGERLKELLKSSR